MITVQHVMQLIARTVHHGVNDAQVGDVLVRALLVADIVVAPDEVEVDAHLAKSLLGVEFRSSDRVDIVRTTAMQTCTTDDFRGLAIPASRHL